MTSNLPRNPGNAEAHPCLDSSEALLSNLQAVVSAGWSIRLPFSFGTSLGDCEPPCHCTQASSQKNAAPSGPAGRFGSRPAPPALELHVPRAGRLGAASSGAPKSGPAAATGRRMGQMGWRTASRSGPGWMHAKVL